MTSSPIFDRINELFNLLNHECKKLQKCQNSIRDKTILNSLLSQIRVLESELKLLLGTSPSSTSVSLSSNREYIDYSGISDIELFKDYFIDKKFSFSEYLDDVKGVLRNRICFIHLNRGMIYKYHLHQECESIKKWREGLCPLHKNRHKFSECKFLRQRCRYHNNEHVIFKCPTLHILIRRYIFDRKHSNRR